MSFPSTTAYNAFCPYTGWSSHWPLASASSPPHELQQDSYCFLNQLWRAIRERRAISADSTVWPVGSFTWKQGGTITAVTDNGDGTISFTDSAASTDFNGAGWVDSLGNKRWTGASAFDLNNDGSIGGSEGSSGTGLFTYAPSTYKLVLYPPDTGTPEATQMGDPNFGLVFTIIDNADTSVKINDDGRLTLNGLTLSQYVGFRYHIIGHGAHTENAGTGWVQRCPPRPNDPELDYGTITASTAGTITDDRDGSTEAWQTPKTPSRWENKDVIFQDGSKWVRRRVAGISFTGPPTMAFTPVASAPPTGEYWVVEQNAYWRPEFRLRLERRTGRKGKFWNPSGAAVPWDSNGSLPWGPMSVWYSGWTDTAYATHDPADDTIGSIKKFTETITRSQGSGASPCTDSPLTVFDTDATISEQDHCGYADALFNPWFPGYSLRGLQWSIEDLFGSAAWLEPKDYSGETAIPQWTTATWRAYWNADNCRTTTITAVPGAPAGTATISAISMPQATPQQGAYTSLPCYFTVLDANGDTKRDGTGTATATTLTWDDSVFEDTGSGSDIGLTVIIAFDWSRRYERRVKYLYPRTVFVPDLDPGPIIPPVDNPPDHINVGSYATTNASTNYAEYDKYGVLSETGPAFLAGEAVRYVADNYEDPTLGLTSVLDPFNDLAYQGLPNVESVSDFPRWEGGKRTGNCTNAGSFWIEDTGQLWEMADNTLKEHTGTATSGSTLTLTDTGKSTDNFWAVVNRFVGMVLEVTFDGGSTYEKRLITAYNSVTQTVTVGVAFPSNTSGKGYRIREPGYTADRGAILNLWKGRKLTVTHGSESRTVTILGNDKHRIYFTDNALEFTPVAGDAYVITQIDPGAVLQVKSTSTNNVAEANGFVLTSDSHATQDTRGQDWHTGTNGAYENCPTIVRHFGRFRRGDCPLALFWNEAFYAVDSLRAIKVSVSYIDFRIWSPDDTGGEEYDGTAFDATYAANLQTGYDAVTAAWTPGTTIDSETVGSPLVPSMDSRVFVSRLDGPSGPGGMDLVVVGAPAVAAKGRCYSPTTLLNASTEFYAHAGCSNLNVPGPFRPEVDPSAPSCTSGGSGGGEFRGEIFDDYGSGLIYNRFFKWYTNAATNVLERRSVERLGEAAITATPDWPTDPINPHTIDPCSVPDGETFTTSVVNGFQVYDQCAVLRFDVEGGLTYVTPP